MSAKTIAGGDVLYRVLDAMDALTEAVFYAFECSRVEAPRKITEGP